MAISKYYKILSPSTTNIMVHDSKNISGQSSYTNTTWYHNLIHGASQRVHRYSEYDVMDDDVDVARALDVIAEEITGNNSKGSLPLQLKITDTEGRINNTMAATIKAALKTWCKIQDWENRIFTTARNTIKYGDCFFIRPKKIGKKLQYVHPRNVTGAVVNDMDITDIKEWEIQNDVKSTNGGLMSTNYAGVAGLISGGDAQHGAMAGSVRIKHEDIVWFTLYNDMADEAPFGVSILKSIFKTFKQKELLEDAIIIYRVQRAPERRVFYIDVGKTPPHLIPSHLEQLKNEIRQKKIPSAGGGKAQVDGIYNPQSMNEDFFFATNGGQSGNRVETLPGGQNLGELQDLDYFYKKMLRGLRIPESYMSNTADGSSIANDGKVGIAYQQEIKFTLYIERLQKALEKTLDEEFKRFLHELKLKVDPSTFEIVLPAPSSYKESREQTINADLLNNFSMADGVESISKRFAKMKYLGWTQEDILVNERMKREEMGLSPDGGARDLPMIYNPDIAEQRGFDGGMGGSGGGASFDDDPFLPDEEADEGEGENAEADIMGDEGEKADNKAPTDK